MGMGLVSGLFLAHCLAQPILDLAQSPFWWHLRLLPKMESSAKDPGRLVVSSLLLALPILPVSLPGSTLFLIRVSCCETTHASSYYHDWLRWAVQSVVPLDFHASCVMAAAQQPCTTAYQLLRQPWGYSVPALATALWL